MLTDINTINLSKVIFARAAGTGQSRASELAEKYGAIRRELRVHFVSNPTLQQKHLLKSISLILTLQSIIFLVQRSFAVLFL